MLAKIQILREDGTVLLEYLWNALGKFTYNAPPGFEFVERDGSILTGFEYKPTVDKARLIVVRTE